MVSSTPRWAARAGTPPRQRPIGAARSLHRSRTAPRAKAMRPCSRLRPERCSGCHAAADSSTVEGTLPPAGVGPPHGKSPELRCVVLHRYLQLHFSVQVADFKPLRLEDEIPWEAHLRVGCGSRCPAYGYRASPRGSATSAMRRPDSRCRCTCPPRRVPSPLRPALS